MPSIKQDTFFWSHWATSSSITFPLCIYSIFWQANEMPILHHLRLTATNAVVLVKLPRICYSPGFFGLPYMFVQNFCLGLWISKSKCQNQLKQFRCVHKVKYIILEFHHSFIVDCVVKSQKINFDWMQCILLLLFSMEFGQFFGNVSQFVSNCENVHMINNQIHNISMWTKFLCNFS